MQNLACKFQVIANLCHRAASQLDQARKEHLTKNLGYLEQFSCDWLHFFNPKLLSRRLTENLIKRISKELQVCLLNRFSLWKVELGHKLFCCRWFGLLCLHYFATQSLRRRLRFLLAIFLFLLRWLKLGLTLQLARFAWLRRAGHNDLGVLLLVLGVSNWKHLLLNRILTNHSLQSSAVCFCKCIVKRKRVLRCLACCLVEVVIQLVLAILIASLHL